MSETINGGVMGAPALLKSETGGRFWAEFFLVRNEGTPGVREGLASNPRSLFHAESTGGKWKGFASNAIGNSGSSGVALGIFSEE